MKKDLFQMMAAAVTLLAATAIVASCDNDEPQKAATETDDDVRIIEKLTDSSQFLFTYRFDESLFAHTDSVFVHYTDDMGELMELTDTLTSKDVLREDREIGVLFGEDAGYTAKKGTLLWQKFIGLNTFDVHQCVRIECNYKDDFSLSYLTNIHVRTLDKDENEVDSYKSQPSINTVSIVTTGKPQGRRELLRDSFHIDNNGKISIGEK